MKLTRKSVLDQVFDLVEEQLRTNRRSNSRDETQIYVGGMTYRPEVREEDGKYVVKITMSCARCPDRVSELRFNTWLGWIPLWKSIQIQSFINEHSPR